MLSEVEKFVSSIKESILIKQSSVDKTIIIIVSVVEDSVSDIRKEF